MFKRALILAAAGLAAAWGAGAAAQVKEIPWGTSAVGSSGHKALVVLAEVLNRELPKYRVTVQPTPGAIVSVKGYATGQFEGYYGADIAFWELANDINRFKGFKAEMKRQPVQSFWAFTVEVGTAVHARNKGKFRGWRDLSGKPVFTGPLPWDVRAHLERAYAALGVKHNYRQVDLSAAGSLLQGGGIEAFIIYTNGEATTAPWITEASLAADWAALNPSAEELETLRKAGFAITEVRPEAFKKDVHADKVLLLPFYYGFHVGLEIPEEDVYQMLKAIEKNLPDLVKADPSYAQIAKDMAGFQRRGVMSSVNFVPIHPGLAKYMREKGVWDPKWDARIAKR
ncbi:MAG TPA: TAXI family TRAP transporter solute-binding subunit [Burkholderiales bacterium]|nr:TAXI family TRAP transporter solute-binding subunit [Burkholderiales bacterium]